MTDLVHRKLRCDKCGTRDYLIENGAKPRCTMCGSEDLADVTRHGGIGLP